MDQPFSAEKFLEKLTDDAKLAKEELKTEEEKKDFEKYIAILSQMKDGYLEVSKSKMKLLSLASAGASLGKNYQKILKNKVDASGELKNALDEYEQKKNEKGKIATKKKWKLLGKVNALILANPDLPLGEYIQKLDSPLLQAVFSLDGGASAITGGPTVPQVRNEADKKFAELYLTYMKGFQQALKADPKRLELGGSLDFLVGYLPKTEDSPGGKAAIGKRLEDWITQLERRLLAYDQEISEEEVVFGKDEEAILSEQQREANEKTIALIKKLLNVEPKKEEKKEEEPGVLGKVRGVFSTVGNALLGAVKSTAGAVKNAVSAVREAGVAGAVRDYIAGIEEPLNAKEKYRLKQAKAMFEAMNRLTPEKDMLPILKKIKDLFEKIDVEDLLESPSDNFRSIGMAAQTAYRETVNACFQYISKERAEVLKRPSAHKAEYFSKLKAFDKFDTLFLSDTTLVDKNEWLSKIASEREKTELNQLLQLPIKQIFTHVQKANRLQKYVRGNDTHYFEKILELLRDPRYSPKPADQAAIVLGLMTHFNKVLIPGATTVGIIKFKDMLKEIELSHQTIFKTIDKNQALEKFKEFVVLHQKQLPDIDHTKDIVKEKEQEKLKEKQKSKVQFHFDSKTERNSKVLGESKYKQSKPREKVDEVTEVKFREGKAGHEFHGKQGQAKPEDFKPPTPPSTPDKKKIE